MNMKWLTPKILEVRFTTSYELCNNTYLFSHHYEIPEWIDKVFTRNELDEFYEQKYADAHWWKKRWAGSNLPDLVFERFIEGDFLNLNDFERSLIDEVSKKNKPYYVVMISDQALYARDHELAHALFYTNEEYKFKALNIVNYWKNKGMLTLPIKQLKSAGYSDKVLDDELHTFCGIYYSVYFEKLGIPIPYKMTEDLMALYEAYKQW